MMNSFKEQKEYQQWIGRQVLLGIFLACPLLFGFSFWFLWTVCKYGQTYFSFLPEIWQNIPLIDCCVLYFLTNVVAIALKGSK